MTTITPEEFVLFSSQFEDNQDLQESLETLEENLKDCDWVLEDATELILVKAKEPSVQGDSLFEKLRKHICEPETRKKWDSFKELVKIVEHLLPFPGPLVVVSLLKLWKIGLNNICE